MNYEDPYNNHPPLTPPNRDTKLKGKNITFVIRNNLDV